MNFTTFDIIKSLYFGFVHVECFLIASMSLNCCLDVLSIPKFSCDTFVGLFRPQAGLTKRQIKKQNPLLNLVFGAMSGLVAQTVCYPLDTVRRRMAVAGSGYTGNINAVTTILAKEGLGGFYRGMLANAMKVAPNNAIRFGAFEFLKNHVL